MSLRSAWFVAALALAAAPTARAGSGVWTSGGPYGGTVTALAVDPSNHARLYAGTGAGVFRSDNAGVSWVRSGVGPIAASSIICIAVDPITSARVYAGTGGYLYKSTDAGATWAADLAIGTTDVLALHIDPAKRTVTGGLEYLHGP